MPDTATTDPIAVIGLGCRFPGAQTPGQLWRILHDGREPITFFQDTELRAAHGSHEMFDDPDYVPAQGMLSRADEFDAGFFRIRPAEATAMDPQHRLLLECAWEAIEDSGHDVSRLTGPVGVFAGAYGNGFGGESNAADYLASRISFKLDLTGPSLAVQTACSTSLVAIHLACQALRTGECRTALAGGVTVRAGQVPGYLARQGGIYSRDGHCRAFDAAADGTGVGDGVGVVVLKRLADALADGDTVRAVVLGSAVGNDGANRVGFTAPGVAGQAAIVRAALERAGVDPRTIGYVEAHGSGTPIGDRIEVEALRRAFDDSGACLIGSVKTNLGHMHAAAGVAGFIKAVLALQHRTIPASLNFSRPNPAIDFDSSPFRVVTERTPWPAVDGPLRAGVSSFGQGGTGAHVVLQEPPGLAGRAEEAPGSYVLPLSARSAEALDAARTRLADHLAGHPELRLADVAHTLQAGRRVFNHRFAVVASTIAEAVDALRDARPAEQAKAWLAGEPADWAPVHNGMRVPLPTYPFQRTRFASAATSSASSPSV
jgi:acyl transferase domain-containing protein